MPEPGPIQATDSVPIITEEGLNRDLTNRHLQMLGLGGAIGVGLFLASGMAIHNAGPSLLLSYAVGGISVFLVLRALGELALYRPVSGSFASYAGEFLGPFAGYMSGWTYWFAYVVAGMAESTAVGLYLHRLVPGIPQWIPAFVMLMVMIIANIISVRFFGEAEFWFALIKVIALIGFIILGVVMVILGLVGVSHSASISNLWAHGGFFPHGFVEPITAMQVVILSLFGLEGVGIAAGETANPESTLPRAINQLVRRIMALYLGAVATLMCLVVWSKFNADTSPFIQVFEHLGFHHAKTLVYFVVITAALSAGTSSLFVTARMLFSLSEYRQAPHIFARLSARKIPTAAVYLSAFVMLLGVILNYIVPERAFAYITSFGTLLGLISWAVILTAHLGYWRAVKSGKITRGTFRMPGAPYTNLVVLAVLGLVAVLFGFHQNSRVALYIAPVWFAALFLGYLAILHRNRTRPDVPPASDG